MPQQTKLKRPLWLHLNQVSLLPPSKRCYNHLSHRHYSSTSTRHHHMSRMQCPNITKLSCRRLNLHLTLKSLSLTTTISIPPPITSLPHKRIQGWLHNWQWHRQRLYPIRREITSIIMAQLLQPGSLVINCHCSKHRYRRLIRQARATTKARVAKTTTIHIL